MAAQVDAPSTVPPATSAVPAAVHAGFIAVPATAPDTAPGAVTAATPQFDGSGISEESEHFEIVPEAAAMDLDVSTVASSPAGESGEVPTISTLQEGLRRVEVSCADKEAYHEALGLLGRYIGNVLANPMEDKFRTIKRTNLRFHAALGRHKAANQLLQLLGFVISSVGEEPSFTLPAAASLQPLALLTQLLNAALPPPPSAVPEPPPQTAPLASNAPLSVAAMTSAAATSGVATGFGAAPALPAAVLTTAALSGPASHEARASRPAGGSFLTVTEAQVASLKAAKTAVRLDRSVDRQMQLLYVDTAEHSAPPRPPEELPDDFYELTESDLRGMSLSSGGGGGDGRQPVMQTAAMKELGRLKALKQYTHAAIRVRLPGGILVQAAYHPQEPVAHVLSLVRSCLDPRLASCAAYLFTTPPRTTLDQSASLVEAGLVPAATAVLAWSAALPPELAALSGPQLLHEQAQAQLRAANADMLSATPFPAELTSASVDGAKAQLVGGGGVADSGTAAGSSAAEGSVAATSSSSQKPSGKGKPKWFK